MRQCRARRGGVRWGLEYIRNIFGANGMTKQVKAVDNMVDALNTLINATVEGKDIEKREETSAETTKNEDATAEEAKGEESQTNYSLKGDVKYLLSEETTKIFDAAKAKFGTTLDMREAGYILPDGSMLDFSGRHQVEGDASFLNGNRTVDHRKIANIAYDAEDNETGINTDLGDFLDRGAIRIDSNAGAINLNVAPTKAQKDRLKRLIERNDGYVYIDFGKGWDTEHYAEYEAARASRVLGDIDRYFDEGIKPTGNVRFSLQEVNDRFNEELDAFKAEQNVSELHLGAPSPLLRACGVSASEIFITAKTLRDHLKKHNLTEDEIKNLPIAINDPIMVYEWGEKAKSKIIITQIPRGEQRITVAIKMERGGRRLSVNELASVHGKDVERLMNEMLTTKSDFGKDNLKYVNKEIAMQWLGIAPPEGAASLTDAQQSIAKIIQNFENPKIGVKYSLSTTPTFYSNAEFAVRGIKQEKATPEQWLKMIEKTGGLKAGEDKWLGLSDWLKASTAKTLTKDEVLQYIAENDIQIEEVSYGDVADISREEIYESAEFAELRESLTEYDEDDNPYINRERYDELRSESYDFVDGFSLDYWGEELEVDSPAAAATYLGLTNADKEINETRLGYTTQGLNNKREIALVVPTIEPYNQSDNIHFGDAGEGRAVAWVRFGETTDADGKRVLVIDEIQSKRHQDGREKGYISDEVLEAQRQYDYLYKKMYKEGLNEEEHNRYHSLGQFIKENYGIVPSAPFEKNWAELAFKRMLRYAAENGYDYVAWTTGDQQADRYDIGSVVKDIVTYDTKDADGNPIKKMKFRMNNMGTYNIATNMEGVIIKGDGEMKGGMHLSDITGKPLAEKIMKGEGEDAMVFENGKDIEAKSLEGEELHIGNEGMKAFYDQMLPSFVKKYSKKWGAEVKDITMPTLEENNTMHAVNVTDSMRESVMQGQPKFSLITPEMDAAYLDAVERGDMATAQRMVMEAAKLAMPNTKVVDEDGEPKVVYHGTPNNFNAFSKEMFGTSTDRGIWGNGFYFSDSEQYAKTYEKRGDKQGRTLTVFLNIENPLFISLRNGGNEGAMYFHELMEKHFTDDIYEDATRTDELMSVAQERLTADIVANGYDGIVVEYTNHIDTEYVAFEPNQIKSADPVTYDDAGNVIPLSERFNPRKEDIRYSLRSMDEGIAILRNKATEYNIDIPLMLIENADEYVMLMREENVKNPEKKANAFATYLSDKELICFNGSHFLDADDEFVADAIMHEYAHHATHQMWNDVLRVITEANRSDILWVRDNVLSEHYNDITPAGTINEIISIFVERMGEEMRHKVFSGKYEIAQLVSNYEKEIETAEDMPEQAGIVLKLTIPLIANNLEIIKKQYNGKRANNIILRRDTSDGERSKRSGEEGNRRDETSKVDLRNSRYDGWRETNERGGGA